MISKWYPSTACQLNDRKFECVFPAYCYCHSIFRHRKHALSGCLQTYHCNLFHLKHGCKYSLFTTYTKPNSSLDFYHGFLFPLEVSRIWSFLYSVFVTICPVLHALQRSIKLHTTLGKVDPSKLAKEKYHGNKSLDFVMFFFFNFFHSI